MKKQTDSTSKKPSGKPRRSEDYRNSVQLLYEFAEFLFKPSDIIYKFCTEIDKVQEVLPLAEYRDWNNKNEQPSIDMIICKMQNPAIRIRIRFCLILATNTKATDVHRGRPDHPIPNEINGKQEMYDYMSHNDYHFCVVSLRGKDPHFPVRFAAGRYDSLPVESYEVRNKYNNKRERKNYFYALPNALLKKETSVGYKNERLLDALTKLIKDHENKQRKSTSCS